MNSTSSTYSTRAVAVVGLLLGLGAGGCTSLTEVKATDVVDPGSLASASGANALFAGAAGTFAAAFAVGHTSVMISSGMAADEFFSGHPVSIWSQYDFRVLADPGFTQPYTDMQRARIASLQAIDALEQYAPTATAKIGEANAYVGYVEVFLAEVMCAGVPLGSLVNQEPVYGEPLTTVEMLEQALTDFNTAATVAGTDVKVTNLSAVGKGRALLNLGRFSEAAAAVAAVPTTWAYRTEHSTAIQVNGYYTAGYISKGAVVADKEGTNGLDFRSANDPRVQWQAAGKAADNVVDHYQALKYNSPSAPVVLASGIEARLIEAEAAYQANKNDTSPTGNGWLGILNTLRQTAITPALPALADPGSQSARENLIFRERAFWMYGTGHRMGDLRRLIRQPYGRGAESVFPTGFNRPGIPYGVDVNFPPDIAQYNNPAYTGCLNRGA